MQIEHIAVWVNDLERMKSFYESNLMAKRMICIIMRKKILSLILLRLVPEQGWKL